MLRSVVLATAVAMLCGCGSRPTGIDINHPDLSETGRLRFGCATLRWWSSPADFRRNGTTADYMIPEFGPELLLDVVERGHAPPAFAPLRGRALQDTKWLQVVQMCDRAGMTDRISREQRGTALVKYSCAMSAALPVGAMARASTDAAFRDTLLIPVLMNVGLEASGRGSDIWEFSFETDQTPDQYRAALGTISRLCSGQPAR